MTPNMDVQEGSIVTLPAGTLVRALKARVFVGVPTYDGWVRGEMVRTAMTACQGEGPVEAVCFDTYGSSLLQKAFNVLWTKAIAERKYTHFAMVHADVVPEPDWLNKLIAEQQRLDCDVLSVVLPIKDQRGISSTAIDLDDSGYSGRNLRRLAIRELAQLPQSFNGGDVASALGLKEHGPLLVNTGLWVARLDRPWVKRVAFRILSGIEWNGSDESEAYVRIVPEDWDFSRQLAEQGARVYATQIVKADHVGQLAFPNAGDWGHFASDTESGTPPLRAHQAALLELLATHFPEAPSSGPIRGVEVGVFDGDTSAALLAHRLDLKLVMVDPYVPGYHPEDPCSRLGYHEMEQVRIQAANRTQFAGERRKVMIRSSVQAALEVPDCSCEFVFVDGCHRYVDCLEDLNAWWRKVKSGGFLAIHDYGAEEPWVQGVTRAVIDFATRRGLTFQTAPGTLAYFEKP